MEHRVDERISTADWRLILLIFVVAVSAATISCTALANSSDAEKRAERNRHALAEANDGIEKYRKSDVTLTVLDKKGRPVKDANVEIRQASHLFHFGCYVKLDDLRAENTAAYELYLSKLFNYAVVGTYWDFIEGEPGRENWAWFDRETELAKSLGMRVGAAPILWGTKKYGTPKWLPRERDQLKNVIGKRVAGSIGRGGAKADDWEVVNEPLAHEQDHFARYAGSDYIDSAFRLARETDPKKRLMINEYGVFGSLAAHHYNRDRYFELLGRLLDNGVPIDVIGIQAHSNGEWFEPANVAEQLQRYAKLGKPIQITEFSAQTRDLRAKGRAMPILGTYRDGVWDDELQASFYREFYTIAFGTPEVEGIVTWGLDDERAWLPGVGLIDRNNLPKPAFRALDSLINREWRTIVSAKTDANGQVNFRGFYGGYNIDVTTSGGRSSRAKHELEKARPNLWTVRVTD